MSKRQAQKAHQEAYEIVNRKRSKAEKSADRKYIYGIEKLTKAYATELSEVESQAQKGFDEADRVEKMYLSQLSKPDQNKLPDTITVSKIIIGE